MFDTEKEKKDFLEKYGISEKTFRDSMVSWNTLREIAVDYNSNLNEHRETVKKYAEVIQGFQGVHSLRYREKNVEHLIEKIIRKNSNYMTKGMAISVKNYMNYITDLMGIRIMMLFKEDWANVHKEMIEHYGDYLAEEPFVYIREGDNQDLYNGKIEIKDKGAYRSAHYLIRTKSGCCVEVQVRTLYEEAWGEIDHKFRYPYDVNNDMIGEYLKLLNRLTGMADEMGSFMRLYIKLFQGSDNIGRLTENEVLNKIMERVSISSDEQLKEDVTQLIISSSEYRKIEKMSNLFKDFMDKI